MTQVLVSSEQEADGDQPTDGFVVQRWETDTSSRDDEIAAEEPVLPNAGTQGILDSERRVRE